MLREYINRLLGIGRQETLNGGNSQGVKISFGDVVYFSFHQTGRTGRASRKATEGCLCHPAVREVKTPQGMSCREALFQPRVALDKGLASAQTFPSPSGCCGGCGRTARKMGDFFHGWGWFPFQQKKRGRKTKCLNPISLAKPKTVIVISEFTSLFSEAWLPGVCECRATAHDVRKGLGFFKRAWNGKLVLQNQANELSSRI